MALKGTAMGSDDMDDAPVPMIDAAACTGCGLCVLRCPEDVVMLESQQVVLVRPEACTYCGICESVCPVNAIALPYLIVWEERVDTGVGST
jgi:ferredoxin